MAVLSHPKGLPLSTPAPLEAKFNAFVGTILIARDQIYERLRQLEESSAQEPYCINPVDVRARLPEHVLKIVVNALPNDIFSLPTGDVSIPKLRKAALEWDIDPKRFLFSVAYDLQKQGGTFFRELQPLVGLSSDWEQCLALLLNCAKVRRSERRPGRKGVGITLSDIKTSIQRLEAQRLTEAVEESSSDFDEEEGQTSESGLESINQTATQSPKTSSANIQSTEATSPTKVHGDENLDKDIAGPSTPQHDFDSPEVGRGSRDTSISRPSLDGEDNDADPGGGSSTYDYEADDFAAVYGGNDFFIEEDGGNDFAGLGGNHSGDDVLCSSRSEGSCTEEVGFNILAEKQVFKDISNQSHKTDASIGRLPLFFQLTVDNPFDFGTKADNFNHCSRGDMVMLMEMCAGGRRGGTSVMAGAGIETLLDASVAVEAVWMNATLGRICDGLGPRFASLDSKETAKVVDRDYQPKIHVVETIGDADILLLPILLEENHWVLCTVDRALDDATTVDIFDSITSIENAEQIERIMDAFFAVYLPSLVPGLLVQQCTCPQQENAADSGIHAILFAISAILKRPLPRSLHVGLWRQILAAFLGGSTEGWDSLLSWDPHAPWENSMKLTDDIWVGGDISSRALDPVVLAAKLRA
ncbi:hypothetical protein CcaCcLH18_13959 [Colletotrichum camelliae]|nr:hypothetical protein CcaCcLH18_13959 [Colletotrichum camelliae]